MDATLLHCTDCYCLNAVLRGEAAQWIQTLARYGDRRSTSLSMLCKEISHVWISCGT